MSQRQEEFLLAAALSDSPECIRWPWSLRKGYGYLKRDGRKVPTHRLAFEIRHGRPPVPQALHECDTSECCNGAHLIEGTQKRNVQDCAARGRIARGDRHGSRTHPERLLRGADWPKIDRPDTIAHGEAIGTARYSAALAVRARELHRGGLTNQSEIARRLGVHRMFVHKVIHGQAWVRSITG